jgi:hypothetical protein
MSSTWRNVGALNLLQAEELALMEPSEVFRASHYRRGTPTEIEGFHAWVIEKVKYMRARMKTNVSFNDQALQRQQRFNRRHAEEATTQ